MPQINGQEVGPIGYGLMGTCSRTTPLQKTLILTLTPIRLDMA